MISKNKSIKFDEIDGNAFRLALEAAPNGQILIDQSGSIIYTNAMIGKIFGYTHDELIGKHIEELIPTRFRSQHPSHREKFFAAPQTRSMGAGRDLHGLTKDNREVPVEIGLNPIQTDKGTLVLAAIIDITARKRIEERFRIALEASPNGMVMIDESGKILLINQQTEQLFGYSRHELIGQSIDILVPDRFKKKHPDFRRNFFNSPQVRSMGTGRDLYGKRKDGSEFPIEIGLNPLKTSEGTFVISSIIDITERKKAAIQLVEKKELERTVQELDNFSYMISHDLKAPMRGIYQVTEWIHSELINKLDKEQTENMNLLMKRVKRLNSMIDGILNYSRIGRVEELKQNVHLDELVQDTIESLNIPPHIRVQILAPLPEITCVLVHVVQIFQNLTSNALRYMDKKEGLIEIGHQDQNTHWLFFVRDNGPGIAKEHFDRIFKIFQTLTPKDDTESTGIGLSIVKKVVELYGGHVWLESELGKGTTFFFTLEKHKEN